MIETSSDLPQRYSAIWAIFGSLLEISENVWRRCSCGPRVIFRDSLEIFGKMSEFFSENREKRGYQFVYIINKIVQQLLTGNEIIKQHF